MNESEHQGSNDNAVRTVNFAPLKNLVVNNTVLSQPNIRVSTSGPLLMERLTTRLFAYC